LAPVWIRIFLPVFCRIENATWAAAGVIGDFSWGRRAADPV